jgi:hypothetical protein
MKVLALGVALFLALGSTLALAQGAGAVVRVEPEGVVQEQVAELELEQAELEQAALERAALGPAERLAEAARLQQLAQPLIPPTYARQIKTKR